MRREVVGGTVNRSLAPFRGLGQFVGGGGKIAQDHPRSAPGQFHGHRSADVAGRPGHQRDGTPVDVPLFVNHRNLLAP